MLNPQVKVRPKYPSFSMNLHFFHAFSLVFSNQNFLGILMFGLFLFIFDHWVFVPSSSTYDSHALI